MSRSTESTATKLVARVKHSADEEWTMGGSVASSAGTLHTEKTLASYVKVTDGVRKVQLKSSFTQSGFRPQVFSFSRCFSQETTQAAFFAECGATHSINCLLDTCGNLETPSTEIGNFCMIAYGQTGSGKSHTMFGSCASGGQPLNHSHIDAAVEENYETETLEEDPHSQPGDGLIVRSIEYLLTQLLHSVAAVPTFHLKLSCFEIYEDLVYDLFSGSNTLPVHVHEDAIEGFSVQGCQLIDCTSFESAAAAIELIARHRRGRYAPNSRTSPLKDKEIHHSVHKVDRSHCIIEISVCVPMTVGEGGMSVYNSGLVTPASQAALLRENEYIAEAVNSPRFVTRAKMTFVDLAGSERLLPDPKVDHKPTAGSAKSANKSLTSNLFGTKEVGVINPSLYVLGRVIAGLVRAHNSTQTSEVPYQDSVLTKLLIAPLARGNLLGANILIACIDDSPRCEYETLRTLKFATSCVQLRNSPDIATPKASKEDRAISELKMSIKKVKEDNQELRRTILATPSWGDKILAHCDEDTLETSAAFANAPPRLKPKIKDVKKPTSLSEKKRTWADWKLFETASAAKNKTKKTSFLPLPSHTSSVMSGSRVYPVTGPVLNGSPTSLSRTSQMSHSFSQGSLQDTQSSNKASPHRGSSAPSPSKQHLQDASMEGEMDGSTAEAREEMRLMELGDGFKHSNDSNDPVYATGGQKIRPKSSPTEKTAFQMGAATMSAFPDSEEDQHDVSRRKLFSKTGPVPARHRATDYFEPVLDGKRGRGPEKTAKDQNHMAEVRMAAQLKKRVLDECKKKNHMPISPYLAHFVPKRVIKDRPTFEVPLLHDIVPLHASIHQDSPDSDDSHGHHSGELRGHSQAHHQSQSGSPGASSSLVAKMNLSGTLHAHSPPRSRPHSRHTKRAQSGRRSSPGSAGRRSPQAGSQSPGKPRSPEIQKLQKLIRTPTMMFELLDAEYQNYPYDEEMYVNRKPLQERIVSSDKPRAAHGPPVITQMADTEEFSPDAALDLSVDGKSLSPAQKKDLKEEPQPDDEGEYDAYDEEFEAEESPVPVQEAPADETPTKVSPETAASPVNFEFVPIASNKIEHPSGKTSPSISRASPTTIPSVPTSAGRAREVPLFPILGAANAPPPPRSPINLSMKMIAPKPSVPSPTQSQKLLFSQPTSRVESPAMTERNWEAEADLLMAPVLAANQERLEQENQIHFLDTFSPPRDSRTNTDSEPQESIAMMRGEVAGEEDYEEEFYEEEEKVEKAPSDPTVEQVETNEDTTTAPVVELEPQPEVECTVEPAGNESEIVADEMAADADPVNNSETAPTEAPADEGAVPGEVEEVPVVAQAAEPAPSQEPDEEDYGEEFEEDEASVQKEEQDDLVTTGPITDTPVEQTEATSSELPAEPTAEADTSSKTVEPVESKNETDAPASDVAPAEDSNIVQNRTDEIEDVISAFLPAEPMATQDSAETVVPAEEPNEKLEEKATDNAATEPSAPTETVASPEHGEKEADYEEDYEMEFNEEEEEEQVSAAPVAVEEVVAPTVDTIVVSSEVPDCGAVATEPELAEASEGAATTEGEVAVETEPQEKQTEVEGEVEQDTPPAEENANNDIDDQVADAQAETTDADSALLSTAFVAEAVVESVSDCAVTDSVEAVAEPVEPVGTAAAEDNEPATSQRAAQVDNMEGNEEENYDEEFEADDNETEAVEKVQSHADAETAEETLTIEPIDNENNLVSNAAVVAQEVAEPSEQEPESAPELVADLPAEEVVGTVGQENADRTEAENFQTSEEIAPKVASPAAESNQKSEPTPTESVPDSNDVAHVKPLTYSPTKPKNFEAFSAKLSGDAVERAVSRLEATSPKPVASSSPLQIDLQDNELTLSPMRHSAGETVLSQMSPISPVRILGDIDSHHFISAATFNTNTTTSEVFAHLQHEDVSELEELSAEYSPDAKLHGIAENDMTNASAASLLTLSPLVDASSRDNAVKDSEEVVASGEKQLQQDVTNGVTAENGRFPVGTRVEANYRGKGRWYAGVISRVRSAAGTVDIDYDDGEKETHVEQDLVRVERSADTVVSESDLPDADYAVATATTGFEAALSTEESELVEAHVGIPLIDSTDMTAENLASMSVEVESNARQGTVSEVKEPCVEASVLTTLPVGTRVEANYRNKGRWYTGVISRVRSAAGTVDIDYDDGEKETHVEQDLVRVEKARDIAPSLDSFKFDVVADGSDAVVDAPVEAAVPEKVVDSPVFVEESEPSVLPVDSVVAALDAPAEISNIESINVPVKDISSSTPVDAASKLKPDADGEQNSPETSASVLATLPVGTRVEANYRGKGRWYAGVISRVRSAAGTVDINYDDGEKETHVEQDLVRLEKASVSPPAEELLETSEIAAFETAGEMEVPAAEIALSEKTSVPLEAVVKERLEDDVVEPTHEVIEETVAAPAADVAGDVVFPVGTRVEGNYRVSGHWYPGVVSAVHGDGSVDLDYDDGEKETGVAASLVRPEVATAAMLGIVSTLGARVEGNYRGSGHWYPGCVSQVHRDGSVDIDYDDGEKETSIAVTLVRLEGSAFVESTSSDSVVEASMPVTVASVAAAPAMSAPVVEAGAAALPVGTRVEGNYHASGHWYPGVVSAMNADGSVDIDYDDGEKETGVAASLVRPEVATAPVSDSALAVGARIEANYRGLGTWYPGSVTHVHADGTADIDYDDGEKETHVASSMIRVTAAPVDVALPVGTRVEGNYRGFGRWYPGVVSSVNADGSVDIDYDDGEKETSVSASLVRLEAPAGDANAVGAEVEFVSSGPVLAASSLVVDDPAVGLLSVGARIEANYRNSGHWYPGCVAQVNADGTVDINYDDGEKETHVALSLVRLEETAVHTPVVADEVSAAIETAVSAVSEPAPSIIEVGSRVEANYRGKGKWLAGEVLRLHGGGMADVKYDHGEVEGFFPPAWLRLVATVEDPVAGTVEDAADYTVMESVDEVSAEAAKDSIEVSVSSALSNAPENDSNASNTIDSEKHVAVEDAGQHAPAADNEAGVQETVAAVPSAEPTIEATELDLVEGTGEMSASGEEGQGQGEGKSILSFGDLLTEVPAASAEKPTEVNAPDDIEAGGEAQVQDAPLSHPEEDFVAVAATQEFEPAAVEKVPTSLEPGEVPAIEAEVEPSVEVETEPVLHPDVVETVAEGDREKVGTEETTSPEEVNTSADTADESEIAPVETVGFEKPLEKSLTQEAAVNGTKIPEASPPFAEQEAPPSVPKQVEQPDVVVEAKPEETPVPEVAEKISTESATVEVSVKESDSTEEPTVEEATSTAPSEPVAELEMEPSKSERAEQSEEQPTASVVNDEVDEVITHESAEPAGLGNVSVKITAEEGPVAELSTEEVENTNLFLPPTEQETQPLLPEQAKAEPEMPPSEFNGPGEAEEPAAVSPVSVGDMPADNHNDNHPSDSKKLTPQASESMFDVDFSELASAKEPPINIADESAVDNKHGQSDQNGKDGEKDKNDKNDIAMDSATLAALALSAESTDDQDQDQGQVLDKQAPVANPHNDVGNKETDDAAQENVSAKPTVSDKSGKSGKSGKSKKSAGGEEEEEDLYDVDF